jgi:hypothetical protein
MDGTEADLNAMGVFMVPGTLRTLRHVSYCDMRLPEGWEYVPMGPDIPGLYDENDQLRVRVFMPHDATAGRPAWMSVQGRGETAATLLCWNEELTLEAVELRSLSPDEFLTFLSTLRHFSLQRSTSAPRQVAAVARRAARWLHEMEGR